MTRIAKALNSGDLEHQEPPCDVDVLAALGGASLKESLGVLIVEAKEGAAGDGPHSVARVKDLQQALKATVSALAQRRRLPVDAEGVAALVAKELILDRCGACQGRGFLPVRYDGRPAEIGQEKTKERECHVCFGSGQGSRDYEARAKAAAKYTRELGEFWESVLQSCASAEATARASIYKRLKENR